jgi:hypothetical protein
MTPRLPAGWAEQRKLLGAILQNRKADAGSIARVPAPEIESLVRDGVCRHLAAMGKEEPTVLADRELIERHVARVVVKPQTLDIGLIPTSETSAQAENPSLTDSAPDLNPATMIALPWTAPSFAAMKGIIHEPSTKPTMKPESRDALLTVIAKARGWIDDIRLDRIAHPQRGVGGVDRGELTAHPGRLLRGHPSPTVQIDCVFRQICPLSAGCRSTGRNPSGRSHAFTSTPRRAPALLRPAGRRRCPVLTTRALRSFIFHANQWLVLKAVRQAPAGPAYTWRPRCTADIFCNLAWWRENVFRGPLLRPFRT